VKTRNKYYNPNPKKHEVGDCVVRAMCKAMEKEWDEVYQDLCSLGMELKAMPNDDIVWKKYLLENGFQYHKVSNKKGSKRPRVNEFAKDNKEGTYILRVANHIVTCVDGYYYDLFDAGSSALYGYYEKV